MHKDFPITEKMTYLDSACMSLKPIQVIEAITDYYYNFPACGGRSHHRLAEIVAHKTKEARKSLAKMINAKPEEIIFTKNATEALNLVANSLDLKGKKVLTTDKEHNSNLLPWQLLKEKGKAEHDVFEFGNMEDLENKMENVKLVSAVHVSNVDGTTLPAEEMVKIVHDNNALIMLDAAQSIPHKPIDVKKLDVDFLAASGHKMLGPTGLGFLYAKKELLEQMPQFLVGGETVKNSTYKTREIEDLPLKFEAGLQHYAGIIGLGAAVNYLTRFGFNKIEKIELELNKIMTDKVLELGGKIIGPEDYKQRSGIVSFNFEGKDPHQIGMMMDSIGNVAVRSGMHCVHSWFNAHNLKGSVRASIYLYNDKNDAIKFNETLEQVMKII